jgi:hypothetical protein
MNRPFNSRTLLTRERVAAAAVALAPLVYFLPATTGALVISPDDGIIFNVPLREAAARITLTGSLPLWNPYIFCGMPLLGAAQAGLLFPTNWFYLFFSAPTATNLMMLTSYALAALGAYLYARRSGANIAGACVTSLVWQWSAFMVCQIGHTNIVQTAAMLPWILWAVDGYAETRTRRRGVVLAALVALQCFAGHQQTFAYSLLLVAAYAVVLARSSKETRETQDERARATREGYVRSLIFIAAGVLLSAVQILPTFELLRNSPRAAATYDFFTSFSMPRRFVLTLSAPFLSGGGDGRLFRAPYVGPSFFGEFVAYVGAATLMLATLAFIIKRDARTKFWTVAALVCLLLALGRYAPLGLYKLIYYVPVLNLFRVPARHLMEVEFALAVLAGRGLTALTSSRGNARVVRRAAAVGACAILLTLLVVTWGRPVDFRLGRTAAGVNLLRAPELFLPVAFAALGAWAVWTFARGRRGASVLLIAVIALDLATFGQSSGWRVGSPKFDFELWGEPETVRYLRERESQSNGEPFRILTEDQLFDPAHPLAPLPAGARWLPELQPDVYMMYGVENAAGYDGFGLARYSRLAGDMKVWGELTDPERTLRSNSRELDLLNVRYLLTRPLPGANINTTTPDATTSSSTPTSSSSSPSPSSATSSSSSASPSSTPSLVVQDFPAATQEFGGFGFAADDLNVPSVGAGARLSFTLPPVEADRIALLTNLSWSVEVPDGAGVARLRLRAENGKTFDFDLRAGEHTSEWAFDRADIRAQVRHARAHVATSYVVEDAQGRYEGHTYVSSFALPEKTVITGGEIAVGHVARAPELTLSVLRVSLLDSTAGKAFPLRREWMKKESAQSSNQPSSQTSKQTSGQSLSPSSKQTPKPSSDKSRASASNQSPAQAQSESSARGETPEGAGEERWRRAARLGDVAVYENTRVLPRAWLASGALVLEEEKMLEVIRTNRLPDGAEWNPRQTALVESPFDFKQESGVQESAVDALSHADVTRREPNRVEVKTASASPSILVVSENHFPGWRAYADGRAVETLRVDYGLRGVVLTAGEHTVEFVYRPKSVIIGIAVSLLTLAALLLWAARVVPESFLRRLGRKRDE